MNWNPYILINRILYLHFSKYKFWIEKKVKFTFVIYNYFDEIFEQSCLYPLYAWRKGKKKSENRVWEANVLTNDGDNDACRSTMYQDRNSVRMKVNDIPTVAHELSMNRLSLPLLKRINKEGSAYSSLDPLR